jgi:hypothetical protein
VAIELAAHSRDLLVSAPIAYDYGLGGHDAWSVSRTELDDCAAEIAPAHDNELFGCETWQECYAVLALDFKFRTGHFCVARDADDRRYQLRCAVPNAAMKTFNGRNEIRAENGWLLTLNSVAAEPEVLQLIRLYPR